MKIVVVGGGGGDGGGAGTISGLLLLGFVIVIATQEYNIQINLISCCDETNTTMVTKFKMADVDVLINFFVVAVVSTVEKIAAGVGAVVPILSLVILGAQSLSMSVGKNQQAIYVAVV